MAIYILNYDLNISLWAGLDMFNRIKTLFLIILSSALIYFIVLYLFKILPKNINEDFKRH